MLAHAVHLPLLLALADIFAFVELALALDQGNDDLGLALLEVDLEGYDGVPLLVCLGKQAIDLAFVEQEFSRAQRFVVVVVGKRVGADVHLVQKHLAVFDLGVGVLQVGLAHSQGLDLGPVSTIPASYWSMMV